MSDPQLELTHRQEFAAAHRLHDPALSDEENRELYGPCNNPRGHGHNYEYEVCVRGPVSRSGMILNLDDLARLMREEVTDRVDHRHLDHDVPFLEGRITTAETLAVAFWNQLQPRIEEYSGCRLHRIRIYESRNSFVDYQGPSR
jgi:6-pyruvoyltetrahydropterin/6-carboxytetrahydropterin synthase